LPPPLLTERWALTPPFHPYLRRAPFEDISKVFLRAITGMRSAGGIFSVALSVNSSTGFRPCFAQNPQAQVCATAPLALPGALPFFAPAAPGLCPALRSRRGVRTFLPLSRSGGSRRRPPQEPAIIRLTRHPDYNAFSEGRKIRFHASFPTENPQLAALSRTLVTAKTQRASANTQAGLPAQAHRVYCSALTQ